MLLFFFFVGLFQDSFFSIICTLHLASASLAIVQAKGAKIWPNWKNNTLTLHTNSRIIFFLKGYPHMTFCCRMLVFLTKSCQNYIVSRTLVFSTESTSSVASQSFWPKLMMSIFNRFFDIRLNRLSENRFFFDFLKFDFDRSIILKSKNRSLHLVKATPSSI